MGNPGLGVFGQLVDLEGSLSIQSGQTISSPSLDPERNDFSSLPTNCHADGITEARRR